MTILLFWLQIALQCTLLMPEPKVTKCVLIPTTGEGQPMEQMITE